MATSVDELTIKAMALPSKARALLAERLVESLDMAMQTIRCRETPFYGIANPYP